ncbi:MAG: DnaA regulatory inactivator Hda [gamma proteobacterium symbiont of Taylorina sp.]|nr:DnaA regulatory inactivator Hda [gamma proteobacterium symbiont of Taylorina sp.]
MKKQIPLSFQLPELADFESFIVGENEQLLFSLKNESDRLIYLWGKKGVGKTHLLESIAHYYQSMDKSAFYLPLLTNSDFEPELLESLENFELVCLDNVNQIAGDKLWEEALFHFFNRIRESGGRLIISAEKNSHNLDINLADLRSRLSWGITYQLKALNDEKKIEALKIRAHSRGFMINDKVAQYIMKRTNRDLSDLMALLDKLDYASLVEQKKLTIPFVKKYL